MPADGLVLDAALPQLCEHDVSRPDLRVPSLDRLDVHGLDGLEVVLSREQLDDHRPRLLEREREERDEVSLRPAARAVALEEPALDVDRARGDLVIVARAPDPDLAVAG